MDKRLSRKAKPVRQARAVVARPKSARPPVAGRSKGGSPGAEASSANQTKILAVDDTAGDLRDLRNALKATHSEVFTSSNGKAAMEFLKGQMVDLIVLDVLMPDMDGYEVCRAIKHDHRTKDIPVIFVTGNIQSEDKNRGLEVGAWDYISKPINKEEVMIRVNNALEIKQARDKLKVATIVPEDQVREQLALQQKMEDFQMGMMTTHWHKRFGQLSANFVEEMKGPLASALGNIRMLMVDDRMDTRHRDKLAMVYSYFRKTEEMLKRLLNVSERVSHAQIVTVAQVVNDSIQLMNLELQYYQIKMVLQLDPTAQWVGLPSELGRAVLYLLHNAIESVTYRPRIYAEFTNDEEAEPDDMKQPKVSDPEIRITVEMDDGQINVHVMDNGAGIKEELLEQIFEPYFTTKSAPHTGAGLHLARSIARAGGGEVAVFSPNSDGLTQFTLALPLFDPTMYEEEFEGEEEMGEEVAETETAAEE
jgi:two-component system, NtrC family, sensor kinase